APLRLLSWARKSRRSPMIPQPGSGEIRNQASQLFNRSQRPALQIGKRRIPASLLRRIDETASLSGSPRERGMRSLSPSSAYPRSKFRGSVWVATGRLPNGAQGSPTNLLDPQPSINPPTTPLRSTRLFVTCGNRTMLSSRRKMAGIWSMGGSECRSQNWPPVRTGYGAGSKNMAGLQPGASSGQKRHPLFWEAALPQRGLNGFRQPADNDTKGA